MLYSRACTPASDQTPTSRSVGCDDSMASYPQCLHYQAAYRVAFVTTVFFVMTTIVSAIEPSWCSTVPYASSIHCLHENGSVVAFF